ncbi:unnamed protein product, partial [Closterium sp. NIES-54]
VHGAQALVHAHLPGVVAVVADAHELVEVVAERHKVQPVRRHARLQRRHLLLQHPSHAAQHIRKPTLGLTTTSATTTAASTASPVTTRVALLPLSATSLVRLSTIPLRHKPLEPLVQIHRCPPARALLAENGRAQAAQAALVAPHGAVSQAAEAPQRRGLLQGGQLRCLEHRVVVPTRTQHRHRHHVGQAARHHLERRPHVLPRPPHVRPSHWPHSPPEPSAPAPSPMPPASRSAQASPPHEVVSPASSPSAASPPPASPMSPASSAAVVPSASPVPPPPAVPLPAILPLASASAPPPAPTSPPPAEAPACTPVCPPLGAVRAYSSLSGPNRSSDGGGDGGIRSRGICEERRGRDGARDEQRSRDGGSPRDSERRAALRGGRRGGNHGGRRRQAATHGGRRMANGEVGAEDGKQRGARGGKQQVGAAWRRSGSRTSCGGQG